MAPTTKDTFTITRTGNGEFLRTCTGPKTSGGCRTGSGEATGTDPATGGIGVAQGRGDAVDDLNVAEAATLAGLMGAIVGSFLNVVAYRLPRKESLVKPRSRCPGCGTPVKPYDNIPVLSWLLLRGHCRSCGESISVRYPLVEALTGVLCVGAVLVHHSAVSITLSILLILLVVPGP